MIPITAVTLLETLSKDYAINSWRIQSNPTLTLSFRFQYTADDSAAIAGHSQVPDKYYRAKAPSTRQRDILRQQNRYSMNRNMDIGYMDMAEKDISYQAANNDSTMFYTKNASEMIDMNDMMDPAVYSEDATSIGTKFIQSTPNLTMQSVT